LARIDGADIEFRIRGIFVGFHWSSEAVLGSSQILCEFAHFWSGSDGEE
jgi:hypothetical protein